MSRASIGIGLAAVLACASCALLPTPKDDCERAAQIFERCGVSLPVLADQACIGFEKALATCIIDVGNDCDALAALSSRLDQCAMDAESTLPPLDPPPLPGLDGGTDSGVADAGVNDGGALEAGVAKQDGAVVHADLGAAPVDLRPAADLSWPGIDASGSIAEGSTRSWQVAVTPGTYLFTMTGTGDADLYVRLGNPPTLNLYDCRPFLNGSDESCTVDVTALNIAYVTIRSDDVASTFTLIAKEQ